MVAGPGFEPIGARFLGADDGT